MPRFAPVTLALPDWVEAALPPTDTLFETAEAQACLAVGLARENAQRQTGGPFGAAVFGPDGRLVAPGVNVVVPQHWSGGHAEMMALLLAQSVRGTHTLAGCTLATSCEPCAMCFGALPWAGIARLVCSARTEDAEAVGFDEGPKPPDWTGELERRGIEVVRGVLRVEGRDVLQTYGGPVYNGDA